MAREVEGNMTERAARRDFSKMLLEDVATDEVSLFDDYYAGANEQAAVLSLGSDFGIVEAAAFVGPIAVWIGTRVFDLLLSWAGEITEKTLQGYLVDQGKTKLKAWLKHPTKAPLVGALSDEGRAEILGYLSRLGAESKLAADQVDLITKKVTQRLFCDSAPAS